MPQLELFSTSPVSRKDAGAYYTPDHVVWSLVRWAVRSEGDLMLDPACGDGRFISYHAHSIGVERDRQAAAVAKQRSPLSRVHNGDFFDWAAVTSERFDCAAGNPPFIRYQTFSGEVRERACRSLPPVTSRTRIDTVEIHYFFNIYQPIGILDIVSDFWLSTRTIVLDPLLRFLDWHMNLFTEHHMDAAAPCNQLRAALPAPAMSEDPA